MELPFRDSEYVETEPVSAALQKTLHSRTSDPNKIKE